MMVTFWTKTTLITLILGMTAITRYLLGLTYLMLPSTTLSWSNIVTNMELATSMSMRSQVTCLSCIQWLPGYIFNSTFLILHAMQYLRSWHSFLGSSAWISHRHLSPCLPLHMHLTSILGLNYWPFVLAVEASIHPPALNTCRMSVSFVIYPFFYRITQGRATTARSRL